MHGRTRFVKEYSHTSRVCTFIDIMVRSFTKCNPFPHGVQHGAHMYVFHKWISAISPLLVNNRFEEESWRTARPWLDFKSVRKCHYEYLASSLGSVKCGPHIVTDAMIKKAVTYEKSVTRIFDHSNADIIRDIITQMYEPCNKENLARSVMMKAVNDELVARGLNTVGQASIGWRNALTELGLHGARTQFKKVRMQARKDCTEEFVHVVDMLFEPSETPCDESLLRNNIGRYLAHQKRNIEDHELAIIRMLRRTGLHLKLRVTNVVDIVLKYYAPVRGYTANRKHIIDVVNECMVPRLYTDPFWDVVFARIDGADMLAPKVGANYDKIITDAFELDASCFTHRRTVKEYVRSVVGDKFCEPMYVAARTRMCKERSEWLPIRKRRKIPWDNIIHDHCKRGQSKHTVPYLNYVLKSMGFDPIHPTNDVWEYVFAKGVQPKVNVLHLIRTCTTIADIKTSRGDILYHVNNTHDLALTEDSLEWGYAMTHFADGALPLKTSSHVHDDKTHRP